MNTPAAIYGVSNSPEEVNLLGKPRGIDPKEKLKEIPILSEKRSLMFSMKEYLLIMLNPISLF
jgi:hypothetical protein